MEAINLKFREFLEIHRIFVMTILFIDSKVVPTTVNNSLFNNNGYNVDAKNCQNIDKLATNIVLCFLLSASKSQPIEVTFNSIRVNYRLRLPLLANLELIRNYGHEGIILRVQKNKVIR